MILDLPHDESEPQDDKKEVIFGWGHHAKDKAGRVFISRHSEIVKLFEKFWEMLESDAVPFDTQESRLITPSDISGLWFRVAYEAPRDWHAKAGPPPDKSRLDIAFTRIRTPGNRSLLIDGTRYNVKNYVPERTFSSLAADLEQPKEGEESEWTLWFATSTSPEKLFVAGSYTFSRPEPGQRVTRFRGEFLNVEKALSPDGGAYDIKKIVLYGRRIDTTWPVSIKLLSDPLEITPNLMSERRLLEVCVKDWEDEEKNHWRLSS